MGILISIVTQEPIAGQPDRHGRHVPAGIPALGLHLHDRQHAAGDSVVTYLVPAGYFVAILKGIYLKGVGLEILAGQVVLLVIYRGRDGCWLANLNSRRNC